jgi:hypothetical protein
LAHAERARAKAGIGGGKRVLAARMLAHGDVVDVETALPSGNDSLKPLTVENPNLVRAITDTGFGKREANR